MDESHVASKEPKQADLPPQLAMWLRLVEAEFRATWERSTDAALQKIRADLTTALAATDAKLAGTVQARLAESAERLSEELAARVDASIAMALEASPGVAATHGEQPTGRSPLMAEVRALLARVAAEQAEVRSRLSQLEAGMVDVAEGLGAQLTEAIERLEFGERDGQPAFEELGTRLAAVEKAIAAVSAEKLAAAVSNGVNEAAGRLRVELAAIGREQAEIRGQLGQLEKAIAGFSDGKLTAVVNSALGDVTERLREQVTAVGREQAAIRARLTEVTEKLGAQLADFRKETGEQLATTVASSVGESTKRLADDVTTNVSTLLGELENARKQTGAAVQAALRETSQAQVAAVKKASESQATALREALKAQEKIWEERLRRLEVAVSKQGAAIAGHGQEASAVRADVVETITTALAAQTRTFEEALMSLAKVVGDERRSSAALVKGSLGTTDQMLRESFQRLEETLATVIEASRQARSQASAAASEAKLARKSITDRRGAPA